MIDGAGMGARGRRLLIAAALAIVAVVAGTLLALGATRGFERGAAMPAAGSEVAADPVGPQPAPVARNAPAIVAPTPAPVEAAGSEDEPVEDEPIEDEDTGRIAGAIARTTQKALRRGEAVRWHKAGREGLVDVGEPHVVDGRLCRNVTAVILGEEEATASRSHLWCAIDEDAREWAPGP